MKTPLETVAYLQIQQNMSYDDALKIVEDLYQPLFNKINALEHAINTLCNCTELSIQLRNDIYGALQPTLEEKTEAYY